MCIRDRCYAFVHPCEDFAETFAAWLDPKYKPPKGDFLLHTKLDVIEELVNKCKDKPPKRKNKYTYNSTAKAKFTPRDYYSREYAKQCLRFLNIDMIKPYLWENQHSSMLTFTEYKMSDLVQWYSGYIAKSVAEVTGVPQYKVKYILRKLKNGCKYRDLKYRAAGPIISPPYELVEALEDLLVFEVLEDIEWGKHSVIMD